MPPSAPRQNGRWCPAAPAGHRVGCRSDESWPRFHWSATAGLPVRASDAKVLGGSERSLAELGKRGDLRLGGLDRVRDLIDRHPGDRAAVVAAHLADLHRPAAPAIPPSLREIAREVVIAIGWKDSGIDIGVAVAPEAEA